ncbi:MAG: 2-oxoacid:acceptor oxidoreductase family protein [Candidatus Omnitrophica bacterium]|nr:2-oxoacid:acceptor oxidoreductase family protein [Candidatus Omnitrophota bacterium]
MVDIKKNKIVRVLIGGSGGQGILTLGRLIATSCIKKNYDVSCLPTYSAEMRGGYIYCFITISKKDEIFSPLSENCDIGVFLNEMSYKLLKRYIKKDGELLINSSLIKNIRKNGKEFEIPATEIAEEIGDIRIANMIMAGSLARLINERFFSFKKSLLFAGIEDIINDEKTVKLCKIAIEKGWNYLNLF